MEEIIKIIRMIGKGWWIVLLATLSALSASLYISYQTDPIYQAKAQFLITPGPSLIAGKDVDIVRSIEALDRPSISATYTEIIDSPRIHNEVATALQLNWADYEQYEIKAVVLPKASVIDLTVQGPEAMVAAALANAIGDRAIAFIEENYLVYEVVSLKPAEVIDDPVNMTAARDAAIAIAMGLIFGITLAWLKEAVAQIGSGAGSTPPMAVPSGGGGPADNKRGEGIVPRPHFSQTFGQTLTRRSDQLAALALIRLEGLAERHATLGQDLYRSIQRYVNELIAQEIGQRGEIEQDGNFGYAILVIDNDLISINAVMRNLLAHLQQPLEIMATGETIFLKPKIGIALKEGNETIDLLRRQAGSALNKTDHAGQEITYFTLDPQQQRTVKGEAIKPQLGLIRGPVYIGGRTRA